jgi:hypothetical protein
MCIFGGIYEPFSEASGWNTPRSGGLNLARPFKAGKVAGHNRIVASATFERTRAVAVQASLTRRGGL